MSFGWSDRQDYAQAEPVRTALPDDLRTESEALEAELEGLDESAEGAGQRWCAIDDRMREIEAQAFVWTPELKAATGAVVYLAHDGTPNIVRGLMTKEEAEARMIGNADEGGDTEEEAAVSAPALPAALVEDLTAHKTAALRIELARSPDVALALVVHAMASSAFYNQGREVLKAGLTTRSLRRSMQDHDACPAVMALEAERERMGDMLPGNPDDLWHWCLNAPQADLLDVLAVAAAHGIDAVAAKSDPNRSGVGGGHALAEALKLDMAQWYAPTAAGYFSRINKAAILADLEVARQAPRAPSWEKMKKGELAALAERETAGTGWLPDPLH